MSLIVDAPISNVGLGVWCAVMAWVFETLCWFNKDVTWLESELTWVASASFLIIRSCTDVTSVALVCICWFIVSCCWTNMVVRTFTDVHSDRQGRHNHQVALLSTSSTYRSWCQWKHRQHLIISLLSDRFNLHCSWQSLLFPLPLVSTVTEPMPSSAVPDDGETVPSAVDAMLGDVGRAVASCSAAAAAVTTRIESDKTTSIYNVSTRVLSKK